MGFHEDTSPEPLGGGRYRLRYEQRWWVIRGPNGGFVAAGLVRDYQLTTAQAGRFVLSAYNDLCPVPGAYDYWAYSTS